MTAGGLAVRGLGQWFGTAEPVLDGLDLTLAPGAFVALLGQSGSGKSTLLRILAGLDTPGAGTVRLPDRRAVVFQEPRLMPWLRVWRNVALGLDVADPRGTALAALAEVGLTHRADAWPLTLSGGEAQRCALARALVREPELLLLDEPFAALDALTRMRMQALVRTLWERHRPATLLVTHDVDEALLLADEALVWSTGGSRCTSRSTCRVPAAATTPGSRASGPCCWRRSAFASWPASERTLLAAAAACPRGGT